jgi:hypothetical protein
MLTSTLQDLHTPANPPQIEFQLSDILDIAPENERTIHFRWDDYQLLVKKKIRELAVFRCGQALKYCAGLADIRDHDYQPSSQDSSE